jgi:photosystem II stability/assembly factor-like uncharacterized protein
VAHDSATFQFLTRLSFVTGTTGWAVGDAGTILKTTTAGR